MIVLYWSERNLTKLHIFAAKHKVIAYSEKLFLFSYPHELLMSLITSSITCDNKGALGSDKYNSNLLVYVVESKTPKNIGFFTT